MEDVVIFAVLLLVFLIPLALWFFLFRWIGRSRRAKREIMALAETLTPEQRDEFDRDVLPSAPNIRQQRDALVEFVRSKDQSPSQ